MNPCKRVVTAAMRRGIEMEPVAAMAYANVATHSRVNLFSSKLIINPKCSLLGRTPDRKVYDTESQATGPLPFGLLEIKEIKEGAVHFSGVHYLSINTATNKLALKRTCEYLYQVQCQLSLSGLEWCDFLAT